MNLKYSCKNCKVKKPKKELILCRLSSGNCTYCSYDCMGKDGWRVESTMGLWEDMPIETAMKFNEWSQNRQD